MSKKTIIVLGSSRSNGDTKQLVNYLIQQHQWDFLDLNDLNFSYYDYQHYNESDDFLPSIERILEYDTIIFATPIYWYTMSGVMKVYFDRISDLLTIRKDMGRQLRGKSMAVISCSDDDGLRQGFLMPFVESADYLGMNYLGHVHGYVNDGIIDKEVKKRLDEFLIA